MIRAETIIGVNNVEKSSNWYQQLLRCKSNHGGNSFEILSDTDGTTILCLHKWEEHNHPTLSNPKMAGNGLILYFRVDNLEEIWENAKGLNSVVEEEPNLNQNSGKREFAIRDLDNYYLLISL